MNRNRNNPGYAVPAVKARRRGSVLALAMTIGVIVGLLGLVMIQMGYHARVLAIRNVQSITARCAADAGAVEAVYRMQEKLSDTAPWDYSTLPSASNQLLEPWAANTSPRYSYSVVYRSPWWWWWWGHAYWDITATGTCGNITRTVRARLKVGSHWEGISVKGLVDIHNGITLNVVGPGVPSDLTVRSNSTETNAMVFRAFVTVPGDIVCGPGGDPNVVIDTKSTTLVLGQMYAAPEPMEFPDVLPPTNMVYCGSLTSGGTTTITGSVQRQYDTINLPNSAVLRINGDAVIYVTGPLILNNAAQIIVDPSGSLRLYLGSTLEDKESAGITNGTNTAKDMRIYGLPGCTRIDLKHGSNLNAAVYAPNADVILFNGANFIGSITAKSFDMRNEADYYYDTSLSTVGIDDPAATFVIQRWWE